MQGQHVLPRLVAELGIEVRERFVVEVDGGVTHHRPRQRHPLPFAAAQLARLPLEQMVDAECAGGLIDARPDLLPRRVSRAQPIGDVLEDRQMRKDGVVLEDHGHVSDPSAAGW